MSQDRNTHKRTSVDQLEDYLVAVGVSAGEVLVHQGDEGGDFMVVLEGKALVTVDEQPVAILSPGSHFGSPALHSEPNRRTATVYALSDCVVGVADREAHETIRTRFPDVLVDVCDSSRQLTAAEGAGIAERCIAPKPRISPMHPSLWRPSTN